MEVDSFVLDLREKRRLTKYHGTMRPLSKSPASAWGRGGEIGRAAFQGGRLPVGRVPAPVGLRLRVRCFGSRPQAGYMPPTRGVRLETLGYSVAAPLRHGGRLEKIPSSVFRPGLMRRALPANREKLARLGAGAWCRRPVQRPKPLGVVNVAHRDAAHPRGMHPVDSAACVLPGARPGMRHKLSTVARRPEAKTGKRFFTDRAGSLLEVRNANSGLGVTPKGLRELPVLISR